MKTTSMLAAVLVVMAGSAYAADFSGLQTVKAADIAAAAESGEGAMFVKEAAVAQKVDSLDKAAFRALLVGYSILIKDTDKKYFEQVYVKNASDFYNIGKQLVGNKINQAAFRVDYATKQNDRMVYIVSITCNGIAIDRFRVDVDVKTGKVEYSLAGD